MGLLRNLRPGEIVEQVLFFQRELGRLRIGGHDRISNIVFMGMGEPFANYERWWQAVERLHDPQGFNLGARSMTVSTVGLVPGIRRLADERLQINLAVSLHAPNDELRTRLMPVNNRYPIAELMEAVRFYIERTNRRVSFEYVLLQGENDTPELAEELAGLLQGMLCHVNLIPWNPVPGHPAGSLAPRACAGFPAHTARAPCSLHSARRARRGHCPQPVGSLQLYRSLCSIRRYRRGPSGKYTSRKEDTASPCPPLLCCGHCLYASASLLRDVEDPVDLTSSGVALNSCQLLCACLAQIVRSCLVEMELSVVAGNQQQQILSLPVNIPHLAGDAECVGSNLLFI
ncbi:MAG: hypothetical protein KatS3mg057_0877 [Herpetosiphonaceae bacterium]|nr:MAG: hypothetical protein KatS3mg057_0877 [Herpetosiphonaceae bacterium]